MTDNVNHPSHYTQGGVECIDAITAATVNKTGIEAVCTANVIKYLWRYEAKNGLEDAKKAQWYINRLIAELEGKAAVTPEPEYRQHVEHVFEATFTDQVSRCIICGLREDELEDKPVVPEVECRHEWVTYGMSKDKRTGALATLSRCRLCGRRKRSEGEL